MQAMDILGLYLTDSPISPLTAHFVETSDPLASWIGFYEQGRAWGLELSCYFGSVPTTKVDEIEGLLRDKLKEVVKEGVDMERMAVVIKKERLKLLNSIESSGGDYFSGSVINGKWRFQFRRVMLNLSSAKPTPDFLYGSADGSELPISLAELDRYEELGKWTSQQWTELLDKYVWGLSLCCSHTLTISWLQVLYLESLPHHPHQALVITRHLSCGN